MFTTREEDLWRINTFSLYDLYGNDLAQEPLPVRVVMKFTISVDLSLVITAMH